MLHKWLRHLVSMATTERSVYPDTQQLKKTLDHKKVKKKRKKEKPFQQVSVRQRDETITTAPISIFSHQAWVVFTGVRSRLKGRDLLGSTHGFVLSVYLCMSVLNLYVRCVSVTAIIQALLLSRCISGFNLFSHRLLFHLSLSSLSHHLSLTQNQITFTLMTVELKQ